MLLLTPLLLARAMVQQLAFGAARKPGGDLAGMRARLLAKLLLLAKLMAPQMAFEAAKMRRAVAAQPGLDGGSALIRGSALPPEADADTGPIFAQEEGVM